MCGDLQQTNKTNHPFEREIGTNPIDLNGLTHSLQTRRFRFAL